MIDIAGLPNFPSEFKGYVVPKSLMFEDKVLDTGQSPSAKSSYPQVSWALFLAGSGNAF